MQYPPAGKVWQKRSIITSVWRIYGVTCPVGKVKRSSMSVGVLRCSSRRYARGSEPG